ncbi:MAG TPA: stage V sporulation protein AE [Firmicutes bacterium]|nr:stage V sporulation protein AE [Bacillota bacterium]
MIPKKIIIITDGDGNAKAAVEKAGQNLGLRTISLSSGNPTLIPKEELVDQILHCQGEPVLVMVDDAGARRKGEGEQRLEGLVKDERLQVLGVLAVASDTEKVEGTPVDLSVNRQGQILRRPVDKEGHAERKGRFRVEGDTVDILNRLDVPIVVGVGDPGKMGEADAVEDGAQITTLAIKEVLKHHGLTH